MRRSLFEALRAASAAVSATTNRKMVKTVDVSAKGNLDGQGSKADKSGEVKIPSARETSFVKPLFSEKTPGNLEANKFLQNLLEHAAQDSLMFDDSGEESEIFQGLQVDKEKITSAANYVFQIAAASQVFFSASVLSTILSEQGFKGVKEIKQDPKILFKGVSMLVLYNIFATEAALAAGKKIRGEGMDESALRAASSILTSSAVETAIGNPLDFLSLKEVFALVKIEHLLKTKPALIEDLRGDKALFEKLVPQNLRELSNEELAKNTAKFKVTENLSALKKFKPEFEISPKEWAKMNAAGSTFAALRNINFYLITYLINQSNAAAKNGEGKELTPLEITGIGMLFAGITSPFNMAAYSAALRALEGLDITEAMKQGLKHAFADTAKNPRIFACLVAIRAAATLACSAIFSDKTKETIGEIVDGLAKTINPLVKSEEEVVAKKVQSEEADKDLTATDRIRTLIKDLDEGYAAALRKSAMETPNSSSKPVANSQVSQSSNEVGNEVRR